MISNTSCPDLKLADKVIVLPSGYQQKFQFSTSTCAINNNNNNNNDISNNRNMSSAQGTLQKQSTKPFTFYTSGGVVASACAPECTTIIFQRTSNKEIAKNSPIVGLQTDQTNEHIQYEPCSYYNSKQENELTKKIFNNIRNDSALKGVLSGGGSGGGAGGDVVTVGKTTSDTSNSCSSSNSSNSSSKSSKSDRLKSPMCRTEDQENAFRQIEDVHNYSKLNRYGYCNGRSSGAANQAMYSSNSSNQDEDEDDDEEEDEGEEEEEDVEDYDDLDYEQHLHAKVRKLSAIRRQSGKVVKSVNATANSAGQKQQRQEVEIGIPETEVKVNTKVEDEANKILPDHHARRPMNAFLIFCKRHRGIVKDKYKNFENRSITKILGEWWASLDANDKKCYVNLAKQNKDAFFSANPNFKWYKLPAPSLRTSNTRPGNIERPISGSSEYRCELNDSLAHNALTYHNIAARCEPKKVAYFKLADETQMGELNNLMRPTATPSTSDALQEALGETSDYFKTGCKRKSSSSFEDPPQTKRLQSDNSFSSSEDDLTPKKSARSCKGKKYQELMNSGQIAAVTPKKQIITKPPRPTFNSSSNNSQQIVMHNGHCNKVTSTIIDPKKEDHSNAVEEYLLPVSPGSYGTPSKQQFSFVSFDLEDKIRALPAQCLETYLQRKKNTKRKKKINSKKRTTSLHKVEEAKGTPLTSQINQPKTAQEAKEQMVGSQKRKARKESITRRDINSIQNDVQVLLSTSSVNPVVIGGSNPQTLIVTSHNATSDLLILAEVAANHTGIAQ